MAPALNCRRISYDQSAHTFNGKVVAPAGGFYTVDLD